MGGGHYDAEGAAATTAKCPEKVWVLACISSTVCAVRSHDLEFEHAVDSKTVGSREDPMAGSQDPAA